jgi:hypothetical protein
MLTDKSTTSARRTKAACVRANVVPVLLGAAPVCPDASGGIIVKKYVKDGKAHYSIADAAKLLGTNSRKVRELMGTGTLEWNQTRANGRLIVEAESILRCKRRRMGSENSSS